MTEKVLLNSGYKLFEMEHPKNCDRFFQKKIDDKKHYLTYELKTIEGTKRLEKKRGNKR